MTCILSVLGWTFAPGKLPLHQNTLGRVKGCREYLFDIWLLIRIYYGKETLFLYTINYTL